MYCMLPVLVRCPDVAARVFPVADIIMNRKHPDNKTCALPA